MPENPVITLSVAEIAALNGTSATLADPGRRLSRVSAPGDATPDAIVFAEDAASLATALASGAGLVLARPAEAGVVSGTPAEAARVLAVAEPRLAFARCARALLPRREALVHPTAAVDPTARLGQRVRIGAGAVIDAGVTVGDDVDIHAGAIIREGTQIGNRVVVQSGAVLGSLGFGYVRDPVSGASILFPQQGTLVIEDDVEIGANCTIDRGALGETRIGQGTKLDNLVHIGHNCRVGRNVLMAAQVGISGSCVIEDGAILAGQVGISDHCHIGAGVILGGQAGVFRGKTVEGPGEMFAGTPAEPLKDYLKGIAKVRRL